jgi:DNA-binding NarL/FixJ family response regulator
VAIARGRKPGAVILDLSMPLGNGWEAAQAIRSFDREALLVAHSSYTSLQECRRAQRAGFDAYFVKPCSLERLIQLINLRFQ